MNELELYHFLGSLYAATNIVLADRYRRDYERLEDVKKQPKPVHYTYYIRG